MIQNNRNIASELIESTVRVIARDGFDKASTRNIAGECGIADAYIYVHFKDKDDLFSKTFQKEDTALAREVKKASADSETNRNNKRRPPLLPVQQRVDAPA